MKNKRRWPRSHFVVKQAKENYSSSRVTTLWEGQQGYSVLEHGGLAPRLLTFQERRDSAEGWETCEHSSYICSTTKIQPKLLFHAINIFKCFLLLLKKWVKWTFFHINSIKLYTMTNHFKNKLSTSGEGGLKDVEQRSGQIITKLFLIYKDHSGHQMEDEWSCEDRFHFSIYSSLHPCPPYSMLHETEICIKRFSF